MNLLADGVESEGAFKVREPLPREGSSLQEVLAVASKRDVRVLAIMPYHDPLDIVEIYGIHSFKASDRQEYDFDQVTKIILARGNEQREYSVNLEDQKAYVP